MAERRQRAHGRRVEAVAGIEVAIDGRFEPARLQRYREAVEIRRQARIDRNAEALDEPSREADVIGMRMRDDEPRQGAAGERAAEKRVPGGARSVVADPSVT